MAVLIRLDGEERKRFEAVLAFAVVTLGFTDADLVPDSAFVAVEGALSQIQNAVSNVPSNPSGYADPLLDAVSALPAARGRDIEQVRARGRGGPNHALRIPDKARDRVRGC